MPLRLKKTSQLCIFSWNVKIRQSWTKVLGTLTNQEPITRSLHLPYRQTLWDNLCTYLSIFRNWLARTICYTVQYNTYGLLTCEVKMAGYCPSSFFACLWTETKLRSINSQKKERGQYPAILTEKTWSVKDWLYGFKGNCACGIQRVVPSGQDGSILPARVANHSARFGSSCPLVELAI